MVETIVENETIEIPTVKGKKIDPLDILHSEAKRLKNRKNIAKDEAYKIHKAKTLKAIVVMEGE